MNDIRQIPQNHRQPTRDAELHATPDASSQGERQSADQLRRKHLRRKRIVALELIMSVMLSTIAIGLVYGIEQQDQPVTVLPDAMLTGPAQIWQPYAAVTLAEDYYLDGVHLLVEREVTADTMRNIVLDSSTTSNPPRESLAYHEPNRNMPSSARWSHEQLLAPDTNVVAAQSMFVATNWSIPQMAAVSLTTVAFVLVGIGIRLAMHDKRRSC
jgi:hypothetical protein